MEIRNELRRKIAVLNAKAKLTNNQSYNTSKDRSISSANGQPAS